MTDTGIDRMQALLAELQTSDEHVPIKLDSQWDVLLEILLTHSYNVVAHGKYSKEGDCCICLDPLHDTYVLEYPCGKTNKKKNDGDHVYHRNCILNHILNEVNKKALFTNAERCPMCNTIIMKNK